MGQKTVRFSDLSGQLILDDNAVARIVVHEHPELGDSPVEIEALADEATMIEKEGVQVAVVDLYFPDDEQPHRVAMELDAFDRLSTEKPMSELLASARPAKRATRATTAAAPRDSRVNYATLEHAGKPHKGKTTAAEKQLVHDNLDEINQRLAAEGIRTISLDDPEHVDRYGLEDLIADEPSSDEARSGKAKIAEAQNAKAQSDEQQSLDAVDEFDAA